MFGLLLVSQFWTLANSLYDSRQARRLFGFIGGGASLGGITGAAVTTYAVDHVGSDNLALVSAGVLLLCAATVLAINKAQGGSIDHREAADDGTAGGREAWRLLLGSRHLQLIALIVGVAALSAVFVEQQLNMAVAESGATTDDITRFLGRVTMYLSMAGFLVQVGLTSRLHRSYGLAAALLLLAVGRRRHERGHSRDWSRVGSRPGARPRHIAAIHRRSHHARSVVPSASGGRNPARETVR